MPNTNTEPTGPIGRFLKSKQSQPTNQISPSRSETDEHIQNLVKQMTSPVANSGLSAKSSSTSPIPSKDQLEFPAKDFTESKY